MPTAVPPFPKLFRVRDALVGAVVMLGLALVAPAIQAADAEAIHPAYLTEADLAEVKRQVEAGADVNSRHIGGGTALHHLINISAQMGMDGLMIRNKQIIRPGQWAATGHEAIALYLVEQGADVNATDAAGMTPLHVAALTGHAAAADFLLKRGAQVNARDAEGHTPLYWARWSATDKAIRELATATGRRINPTGVKRRAASVEKTLEANGAVDG